MIKPHLSILRFKQNGRLFGFGSSAKRDWKIIFYVTSLLAFGAVMFCAYTFLTIDKSEVFLEQSRLADEAVDPKTLVKVVSYYQKKGENLKLLVGSGLVSTTASTTASSTPSTKEKLPDPSL